eukprot:m.276152 g.276152  ORF g.276152 m.276152 type:complete len:854 (-) comp16139_c0_seq2:1731-4292(-)
MVKGTAATPAAAAAATGELNRAVEIWDTAVTRIEADDGQESVKLLTPLLKAAEARRQLRRYVEATERFTRLMMLGTVHGNFSAQGEGFLGMALCAEAMQEWEAAEQAGRQLVDTIDAIVEAEPSASTEATDLWCVQCLNVVGVACRETRRPEEAAPLHLRALKLARNMGLPPYVAQSTRGLGKAMAIIEGEKYEDVAQVLVDSLKLHEMAAGKGNPHYAAAQVDLSELWLSNGNASDAAAAAQLLRDATAVLLAPEAPPSFDGARAARLLGDCLLLSAGFADAATEAKGWYDRVAETLQALAKDPQLGPSSAATALALERKAMIPLALALERTGQPGEAAAVQARVVEHFEASDGPDAESTRANRAQLDRYRRLAAGEAVDGDGTAALPKSGPIAPKSASSHPKSAAAEQPVNDVVAFVESGGTKPAGKKKKRQRKKKGKRGKGAESTTPDHAAPSAEPAAASPPHSNGREHTEPASADGPAEGVAPSDAGVAPSDAPGLVDPVAQTVPRPPPVDVAAEPEEWVDDACQGDSGAEVNQRFDSFQDVNTYAPPPADPTDEPAQQSRRVSDFSAVNHYAAPPPDDADEEAGEEGGPTATGGRNVEGDGLGVLAGTRSYTQPPVDEGDETEGGDGSSRPPSQFSGANHYAPPPPADADGPEADVLSPTRPLSAFSAANHYDQAPADVDSEGPSPARPPSAFTAANHYAQPPVDPESEAEGSPARGASRGLEVEVDAPVPSAAASRADEGRGGDAPNAAADARAAVVGSRPTQLSEPAAKPPPTASAHRGRGVGAASARVTPGPAAPAVASLRSRAPPVGAAGLQEDGEGWTVAHYAAVGVFVAVVGGIIFSRLKKE